MTIIVGHIQRLQDNDPFQKQYINAYRRKRSGSVILVATKFDDLNEENKATSRLDAVASDQLAHVDEKLSVVKTEIRILDNDIMHNRLHNKNKANKKLRKQKERLKSRKNTLARQRKDLLIDCRNRQVTSVLGRNYRTHTNDDAGAAVYCVSNRMYLRHLRGYDKTDKDNVPTMTVEQTQIPAFCSHIYVLPSKGRTASLDHHVRVTVPTLLNIIQMSCSTTSMARASHLVAIVKKSREDLEARMKELGQKFLITDVKLLHTTLADPALQSRFDTQARKSLEKWEKNLHTGLLATEKAIILKKKRDITFKWDEDSLKPVMPAIDLTFRVMIDDSLETYKAEASQASKEIIHDLDQVLKNDPKALACDAYSLCFKDNLIRFKEEIDMHVEATATDLKKDMGIIHGRATSFKSDDYFPKPMNDIYEKAWHAKGAGKGVTMFDARKAYLKDAIPGPNGPFPNIARRSKKDAEKAINRGSQALQKGPDEMLKSVQIAFDRMKSKKENDTPEGQKFRTGLHQLFVESERILNGVAQECLDLCKAYK